MKAISSRDNPLVKRLHLLAHQARERRRLGETLLDGAHLVQAARAAGLPLHQLIVSDSGYRRDEIAALVAELDGTGDCDCVLLPDALFAHVSPVDSPSGIVAVARPPAVQAPPPLDRSLVVLDGVQDPGNLGTILRTAAAAGVRDVLTTVGCTQAWSPRSLRAGMGAQFQLAIHEQIDVVAALADFRGQIVATALDPAARPLYDCDLRGAVAWLFGAEGQGLSAAVRALARTLVIIPMESGVESLNVGAAAAVCLFEQRRQRGWQG